MQDLLGWPLRTCGSKLAIFAELVVVVRIVKNVSSATIKSRVYMEQI